MKPYYEDGLVTIYHGDCREWMPDADVIVTDPPYGIGFQYDAYEDDRAGWYALMDAVVPMMRRAAPLVIMPCCGLDRLPWWYDRHAPDWLIGWSKGSPGQLSPIGFSAWEALLVWGRPTSKMHDHMTVNAQAFDDSGHPCPKPMPWARWLVSRAAPEGGTVLDPFAGSGTTLFAAKSLGRRAIGIEMSERYCEIAARRCSQEVLSFLPPTADHSADQLALDGSEDAA